MRYDDIGAYVFAADIYCPEHIVAEVLKHRTECESWRLDYATTEGDLDRIASVLGIDREREETFDSGEFPKVVLWGTIDQREYCGHGHVIEGTEEFGDPNAE